MSVSSVMCERASSATAWTSHSPITQRMISWDDAPNIDAEVLAELYNQTGGSFRALIQGRKHGDLRFLLNPLGALPQLSAPEEVAFLNYDPSSRADGIWYLSHTIGEMQSGSASSTGAASSKEDKRLVVPEHYDIDTMIGQFDAVIRRVETAAGRNVYLTVICDLRFHPLRDHVRVIKFDLLPDMGIKRVTVDGLPGSAVKESAFKDGSLYLVLAQPLVANQSYVVRFEYVSKSNEMIRYRDWRVRLIEIVPTKAWYPRIDAVSRATYDMTFRVSREFTVIASGDRVGSVTRGGQEISEWESKIALPAVGFNYGIFFGHDRTLPSSAANLSGFRLEAWLGQGQRDIFTRGAAVGLDRAENAVRIFTKWFGEPPYRRLAVTDALYQGSMPTLLFSSLPQMTDAGRPIVHNTALGLAGVRQPAMPLAFDDPLARDVSRQWWGALVAPASFHEEWLMRGLADFSGSIYDMTVQSE
jgi:hypothetical protein